MSDWIEDILAKEKRAHQRFFGKAFDLSKFQAILECHDQATVSEWLGLGLEPHHLPAVAMLQGSPFPGWKVGPNNWFYEQVDDGKVLRLQPGGCLAPDREAFRLEGINVLIDTRAKPDYDHGWQMFENDNLLGPIIQRLRQEGKLVQLERGPLSSRFGVSAKEWQEQVRPALAHSLDIESELVRLERAIEANAIPQLYPHMPRHGDGEADTWLWCEEFSAIPALRLQGGRSRHGGLAMVGCYGNHYQSDRGAFRPLVVFEN